LIEAGSSFFSNRTRKRKFLNDMNLVVPWAELVALIHPYAPSGKTGRPPFAVQTLLRSYFMQQWFTLSDPATEEALHDTPLYCEFARLDPGMSRLHDESTILRFRHLLEANDLALQIMASVNAAKGLLLKEGTALNATLIAALCSTKNSSGSRDSELHQTKQGSQWHFGMKAHIGVDADSGLVHTMIGTAANAPT
jgi:transposase, IS5 family